MCCKITAMWLQGYGQGQNVQGQGQGLDVQGQGHEMPQEATTIYRATYASADVMINLSRCILKNV